MSTDIYMNSYLYTPKSTHLYIQDLSHCAVVANMLDSDIVVTEFEFKFHYYVHFSINTLRKAMVLLSYKLWVK